MTAIDMAYKALDESNRYTMSSMINESIARANVLALLAIAEELKRHNDTEDDINQFLRSCGLEEVDE